MTQKWVQDARSERGHDLIMVLVGNKTDLEENRVVTFDEGKKQADEFNALFIETSCKAGYNIKVLFRKVAERLPADSKLSHRERLDLQSPKYPSNQGNCAC